MTAAEQERDQVFAEVQLANHDAITAGLTVLRRWAATGLVFSANEVRAELADVGITGSAVGPLFGRAVKDHTLVAVGVVRSTDRRTKAHRITTYVSSRPSARPEVVAVPVSRDRTGRFATPAVEGTALSLFDIPPTEGRTA